MEQVHFKTVMRSQISGKSVGSPNEDSKKAILNSPETRSFLRICFRRLTSSISCKPSRAAAKASDIRYADCFVWIGAFDCQHQRRHAISNLGRTAASSFNWACCCSANAKENVEGNFRGSSCHIFLFSLQGLSAYRRRPRPTRGAMSAVSGALTAPVSVLAEQAWPGSISADRTRGQRIARIIKRLPQ